MGTSTTVRSAVYRRHNGTNWEKIYFETSANLVHETDDAWFLKRSNTVNGMSFTKTSGITLTGGDILWRDGVDQYISGKIRDMDNTASDLATRLAKIEGAYSSGDIITTANMNTKITKVGTVTSGTWNGTAITDAYIASASKWNGYGTSKQDKLIFDTTNLSDSTTNVPKSSAVRKYVDISIRAVTAIAQGKTKTYVIDATKTDVGGIPVLNSKFNIAKTSSKNDFVITAKELGNIGAVDGNIIDIAEKMNVGDIILTTGKGIKDWFLGMIDDEGITFYQIDSDTPDLTGYALLSDLGTAAFRNISSRGPSGAGEFLVTEAQVKSFVEGKGYITSNTNTAYTFAEGTTNGAFTVTPSGGSAQSVKVHGLAAAAYKGVDTAAFATSSTSANLPTTAAVAGTIAKRATKVAIQQAEPTNLQTGDIWIELTN